MRTIGLTITWPFIYAVSLVSHGIICTHLLGRHVEGDGPEVDLLVGVDAGHDEEQARTLLDDSIF
jgi:hypothetical protein